MNGMTLEKIQVMRKNMSGNIFYLIGDATEPAKTITENDELTPRVICHICNDLGGWGRGFVLAISKKWDAPEREYRLWASGAETNYPNFELGQIQAIEVEKDLFVINMIAQHGVRWINDIPPIRYDRVRQCLNKVAMVARYIGINTTIHMPRIGAGLAGGTWQIIEGLIKETLVVKGFDVWVYDLPEEK